MARLEVYDDGSGWVEGEDGRGGAVMSASANTDGLPPALIAQMDVLLERQTQREEFSGEVDDALEPAEWIARVAKHLGRAVSTDPAVFRQEMVVVGALALASIESFDRKYGP